MTNNLVSLIDNKFESAKKDGDLFLFDSTVVTKESGGINFELNYVPALAKKPTSTRKDEDKGNPFLNPNPALTVKDLDNHRILLNKYSVVRNHILLVTKEYKEQTELLLPDDLYEAFNCIREFGAQPTLAFYNCGSNSGASQQHKHLQIIPLIHRERIQPPIKRLYDEIHDRHVGQIYAINKLPFVHVILELDRNTIRSATDKEELTEYLSAMFFGLLDAMFQQLRENTELVTDSYNFLMTEDFMMLVPRTKENAVIEKDGKIHEFSLNSLAFAGLILCKTEEQLKLMETQDNLVDLLSQVTVGWSKAGDKITADREAAQNAELA